MFVDRAAKGPIIGSRPAKAHTLGLGSRLARNAFQIAPSAVDADHLRIEHRDPVVLGTHRNRIKGLATAGTAGITGIEV